MIRAVIFDVDGTLVDSVDLHAKAWQDALRDYGYEVAFQDIRDQIGKGGDQLLPVFLSADELESKGAELEQPSRRDFEATISLQDSGLPRRAGAIPAVEAGRDSDRAGFVSEGGRVGGLQEGC